MRVILVVKEHVFVFGLDIQAFFINQAEEKQKKSEAF